MKKIRKQFLIVFGTLFFLLFVVVSIRFYIMGTPTSGHMIEQYSQPQKALLVIDMQEDYIGKTAAPPFPYTDSEKLITRVNHIIKQAHSEGFLIVYIRQEFNENPLDYIFSRGRAIKGKAGAQIDNRITKVSDHAFPKPQGDSFSNPAFEEFLVKNQVNELFLVGLDAAMCIHLTAKGGRKRGYAVTVIEDAVATQFEKRWNTLKKKYTEEGIGLIPREQLFN